jgi:WD40 repeat protein
MAGVPRHRQRRVAGRVNSSYVRDISISPDGRKVALMAAGGSFVILDLVDGARRAVPEAEWCIIQAACFSHDGRSLAWSVRGGKTVSVFDVAGGAVVRELEDRRSANCLAFGPKGMTLACGYDDGKIVLWDARAGEIIKTLQTQAEEVAEQEQPRATR